MSSLTAQEIINLLQKNKISTQKELAELSSFAEKNKLTFPEALIQRDIISDEELGKLLASHFSLPFVNLSKLVIPPEAFDSIPFSLAEKYKIVIFSRDDKLLKIATSAPPVNSEILENIAKKTGLKVELYYSGEIDVENVLQNHRQDLQSTFEKLLKDGVTTTNVDGTDDPPVEKIVNLLIETAYHEKTSDIHIEPQEKNAIIRFRIDGILSDVLTVPKLLHDRLVTRIKVMSSLRTDEHLSAQDGKIKFHTKEVYFDLRVSIIPIVDGEKVVMRLLTSNLGDFGLSDLGMNEKDMEKVKNAFNKSYGMLLSTGPTGSGKTSSIYSILKILNAREKNITTIEDPVEYRIVGANQIQVNNRTNLTFANGLRSILRQDPNIIFVGEIRDNETAGIAINAALTGHLVLSTLHTNTAAAAISRFIDMDVEPFLVASTVSVIVGQRLVRRICDKCRVSFTITRDELLKSLSEDMITKHYIPVGKNKEIRIYKGKGCKFCHNTGYTGRIGLFEVLEVSKKIRELIAKRVGTDEILDQAKKEGFNTMQD
ncbi:MAG TPA: GspE/PulE family protein, partial [Candidatus Methanoperedens sp.]|nr:GspE/PulE family protein [Candidatus Methanoperedens sp.]